MTANKTLPKYPRYPRHPRDSCLILELALLAHPQAKQCSFSSCCCRTTITPRSLRFLHRLLSIPLILLSSFIQHPSGGSSLPHGMGDVLSAQTLCCSSSLPFSTPPLPPTDDGSSFVPHHTHKVSRHQNNTPTMTASDITGSAFAIYQIM